MRTLKLYQSAIAALVVLLFWGTALAIPDRSGPTPTWTRLGLGLVGASLVVGGAAAIRRGFRLEGDAKAERVALATVLILVGLVAVSSGLLLGRPLELQPAGRFALGVGGAALAGFAYATTQFDSIRAAASVPVVVLLVGVVVWPGAGDLVDNEVRQALITWMGVILAVSGTAEAAKQVGESVAKAQVGRADVRSGGDLSTTEPRHSNGLHSDIPPAVPRA